MEAIDAALQQVFGILLSKMLFDNSRYRSFIKKDFEYQLSPRTGSDHRIIDIPPWWALWVHPSLAVEQTGAKPYFIIPINSDVLLNFKSTQLINWSIV